MEGSRYWIHDLDPFLIQFGEGFGLRYYGIAYALGFLIGLWLLKLYHKKGLSPFDANQRIDIFFYLMLGVMIGGRLGYFLFYQPVSLLREPWIFFRVWEGGMASHGGFIGVAAATALIARRYRQPFGKVADLLCSLAPAGIMLGRIANFINGELWGKVSYVSWAIIFPDAGDGLPRHPSQLYAAGLEGLILLVYSQWRIWKTDVLKKPGQLFGEFLTGYAIVRIIGEQFREPDASLILGMSRGTALSILVGIVGLAIILRARKTKAS